MTDLPIPPAIIMILGAGLLPFIHKYARYFVVLVTPILACAQVWNIPVGENLLSLNIANFELSLLYGHAYSKIFGTIFTIAAFGAALFGLTQSKLSETVSAFIYAGSALGVVYSGDLISLFLYWELMAISSTLVIFASDRKKSKNAAMRYALMHFLGGVVLLTGIIAYISLTGSSDIVAFNAPTSILIPEFWALDMNAIVMWLILIGVLVNAAVPPFSAWLPDSYPEGSAFGSVYLSAFTTKTAVFVLLTLFPGTEILIYIGMFMIFYGIIWAILENDMRRILSYSIINQVGFMVVGIGIGTEMSLNGAAAHAFAHIIYKALLFMSAGSVLYMTGKSKCSELGGLYRTMHVTAACGIVGALAISAFPLTSGFVSKSMISSAAIHEGMEYVWYGLLAASAGVFLHAGIKFPWFVFFQKDSGMRPKDPPLNMQLAMGIFAALCIIPAIPGWAELTLYKMLPTPTDYKSYTTEHVVSQLQLLLFSGLAFFVLLPLLKRTPTITLDFDWIYRGFGRYIVLGVALMSKLPIRIGRILFKKMLKKSLHMISHIHSPDGVIARAWPIGTTVLWSVAFLGLYLVIYYF